MLLAAVVFVFFCRPPSVSPLRLRPVAPSSLPTHDTRHLFLTSIFLPPFFLGALFVFLEEVLRPQPASAVSFFFSAAFQLLGICQLRRCSSFSLWSVREHQITLAVPATIPAPFSIPHRRSLPIFHSIPGPSTLPLLLPRATSETTSAICSTDQTTTTAGLKISADEKDAAPIRAPRQHYHYLTRSPDAPCAWQ